MAGIVGYGANVPSYRIKVEEIAKVWGDNPDSISNGLVVNEKSVPSADEDTATIAVTAARYALRRAQIDPQDIGAVYVGSESHPYAVKPTATIVAEAIGATPDMTAQEIGNLLKDYVPTMTYTGLTGDNCTWSTSGAVEKAPKTYMIQDGAYVSAD